MRNRSLFFFLVISLIFASATGLGLLLRLAYALILILGFSYLWSWINLLWLEVRIGRRTDQTQVGGWAEEEVQVQSRGKFSRLWVELQDNTDLPGPTPTTVLTLSEGRRRTWRVQIPCRRRGRYVLGPVTVSSGDPFGLFKVKRTLGDTHNLLVYPTAVPLPHFALPHADLPREAPQHLRTPQITSDASGVREYIPGDSFNRIHWPTTAHTGRLIVKEFEQERSSDIWIILDTHQGVQKGTEEESTEEYGVTIAASIAKAYLDANYFLGLIAYGDQRYLLPLNRGGSQLSRVMEYLTLVKAQGTVPLAEVLAKERNRFDRRTSVVVITPSTDELWVTSLGHLLRRGVIATVVLLEADTFAPSDSPLPVIGGLTASNLPFYLIKKRENLGEALRSAAKRGARPTIPVPQGGGLE